MNEVLDLDVDVELDWLEGLDEPGELLWAKDGWSLADVPVANSARRYEAVNGLAAWFINPAEQLQTEAVP